MSLAHEFQQTIDEQAPDWSDLLFELHLHDELQFDEARLSMAPAQLQRRAGERNVFTFRVSRVRGYGAHAPLVEACLHKLDRSHIDADLDLVQVLHAVDPNWTQGPVLPPS